MVILGKDELLNGSNIIQDVRYSGIRNRSEAPITLEFYGEQTLLCRVNLGLSVVDLLYIVTSTPSVCVNLRDLFTRELIHACGERDQLTFVMERLMAPRARLSIERFGQHRKNCSVDIRLDFEGAPAESHKQYRVSELPGLESIPD